MSLPIAALRGADYAARPVAGGLPWRGAARAGGIGAVGLLLDLAVAPGLFASLPVPPSFALVLFAWAAAGAGAHAGILGGLALGLALDLLLGGPAVSAGAWAAAGYAAGIVGRLMSDQRSGRPLAVLAGSAAAGAVGAALALIAAAPSPSPLVLAGRTILDAAAAGLGGLLLAGLGRLIGRSAAATPGRGDLRLAR